MHDPDREDRTTGWTGPELLGEPGGGRPRRGPAALWRRRSVRGRAVIAGTTVAVLALGGTVAYAATSDGSGTASPGASSSASPSPGEPDGRHGHLGRWFGGAGAGVHGEATVKDRDSGEWIVRVWQRGTVEKTDGDQVTVKSEDGTSWTWTVSGDTTVRRFDDSSSGSPEKDSGAGALKKGDRAVLVGTRADDGTRTAVHAVSGDLDALKDRAPRDRHDRHSFHGPRGHGGRPSAPPGTPESGTTT
ncbi:hypothetical protein [Streptomyces actuosus]|nr:hypothetical protein [Streptomyces actuosus]